MKKITMSAVALTAIMGSFNSVSAEGINILDDLVLDGEIRPRYEMVDDGNANTANASAITARTKLKVTGKLMDVDGLTASVGIISVNNFGSHEYNWNGTTYNDGTKPYATVMDPQAAMISNAEINYKTGDTLLHAGRSQINLDNQRFIGTVGWRQFERSYDSVYVANNSVENLSLLAAWIYGFQGVQDNETTDTNSVVLHASYNVNEMLKVTAYDYMLANIHDTYGIALTGKIKTDMAKLTYRAEYALQSDATMEIHTQTPTTGLADADYYNLDLGANISGILAGVNYEVLSGANASGSETAFTPTLGTNHKFNGWADVFYVATTPNGGLQDFNVRLGYTAKGMGKLLAVYHTFTADTNVMVDSAGNSSDDLGSEFDIVYTNKIPGVNGLSGLLKYADYSKGTAGNDAADDTWRRDKQVFWAQLDYKFSTK